MKINISTKKQLGGWALACGMLLSAGTAGATTIYNPALSIPALAGQTITVTPNSIKSLSETAGDFKADYGSFGDLQVKGAMESSAWFDQAITLISNPTDGDCGTGLVTCVDVKNTPKSGTYSGLLGNLADNANLFVVHVGGSKTEGVILAFLYSSYINNFSVSGFDHGVSWIRAYRAPGSLSTNPVPLPAGILLLISALGGLGFLARFRKAGAKS